MVKSASCCWRDGFDIIIYLFIYYLLILIYLIYFLFIYILFIFYLLIYLNIFKFNLFISFNMSVFYDKLVGEKSGIYPFV